MAPEFKLRGIRVFERHVGFQAPFRFGDVTVTSAPQIFVEAEIEIGGKRSVGRAAELMVPKWFDKNPVLSVEQTIAELRRSVGIARELYLSARGARTAFGLHAGILQDQLAACRKHGLPDLAAMYGPAEIDKAILDALLRHAGLDLFAGIARNLPGIDARLTPDLDQAAIDRFLQSRVAPASIAVRHTVGMADDPGSLAGIVRESGCRYFKIKLRGDPEPDIGRLGDLMAVLGKLGIEYFATLDANEQYGDKRRLLELVRQLKAPGFRDFSRRLLYIEQPFPREVTRATPLDDAGSDFAFIIDEADDHYGAFAEARMLGYRGVSSKACKGLYKSLLNGARSMRWNADGEKTFIAAEDLTCQAGLAVQQDTALAALLGCSHVERNGHHYVDGFADTPPDEARAFLKAHPDLYEEAGGRIRLRIRDGLLRIGSLAVPGFASGVSPESLSSLREQSPNTEKVT
jgi:hypothetical protein